MSDEVRVTVAGHMRKSQQMLHDAGLLLRAGSHESAVSRAYYAVFHASQAMLATVGFSAKKHSGVMSEFSRRFVKTGRLDVRVSRTLHRLFDERTDADYRVSAQVAVETAEDLVQGAREFVQTMERTLIEEGLHESDD